MSWKVGVVITIILIYTVIMKSLWLISGKYQVAVVSAFVCPQAAVPNLLT